MYFYDRNTYKQSLYLADIYFHKSWCVTMQKEIMQLNSIVHQITYIYRLDIFLVNQFIYYNQTVRMTFIGEELSLCLSPLPLLPVIIMILFIACYLAFRKYKVVIELRNIPHYTILDVDLSKVKLNLKIHSMTFSFLLLLSILEFLSTIFLEFYIISSFMLSCLNTAHSKFHFNDVLVNWLRHFMYHINAHNGTLILDNLFICTVTLITPITGLFLIVLRRAYLNLPFKRWIIGYTIMLIIRFNLLFILASTNQIAYLIRLVHFPIGIIDFCIYISCSRSFYRLLKGRSFEARWHSTLSDYKIKRQIANQFLFAQVYTVFCFLLLLVAFLTDFLYTPLTIALYYPNFIHNISLGFFPTIVLPTQLQSIIYDLHHIANLIEIIVVAILFVVLYFGYFIICIAIIVKLICKRKRYNHVNDWVTRPLMEEYRATFDSSNRNYEQRPPFIQAFRSRLVY